DNLCGAKVNLNCWTKQSGHTWHGREFEPMTGEKTGPVDLSEGKCVRFQTVSNAGSTSAFVWALATTVRCAASTISGTAFTTLTPERPTTRCAPPWKCARDNAGIRGSSSNRTGRSGCGEGWWVAGVRQEPC